MKNRILMVLGLVTLGAFSYLASMFNLMKQERIAAEQKEVTEISKQVAMNCGIGGI